jgi:hypothetical protein
MKIHAGYEIAYDCLQPTPMIITLSVHPSLRSNLLTPDQMMLHPHVPMTEYWDRYGNICQVIRAPAGRITLSADFFIQDSGETDEVAPGATQAPLETLPVDTLVYLFGSRYCETDRLSNFAWATFGKIPQGWTLVQAIVDYVHNHVTFGYPHANVSRTAFDTLHRRQGRVPRLRPSRRDAVPLHEHPGALLHRLSRRHRRAPGPRADGFQRLVRGLCR